MALRGAAVALTFALIFVHLRFRSLHRGNGLYQSYNPSTRGKVPRLLYMMSTGPPHNQFVSDVIAAHPGFKVKVFSPAAASKFVRRHCRLAAAAYDGLRPIALKADVFRACALWATGGVWLDHDIELVMHLRVLDNVPGNFIAFHDALHWRPSWLPLLCYTRDVFNGMLAARRPKDPILRCVLRRAILAVQRRDTTLRDLDVAGPGAIGLCLSRKRHADASIIGILQKTVIRFWTGETFGRHHSKGVPTHNVTRYTDMRPEEWYI